MTTKLGSLDRFFYNQRRRCQYKLSRSLARVHDARRRDGRELQQEQPRVFMDVHSLPSAHRPPRLDERDGDQD
jgi:hypothetical protein